MIFIIRASRFRVPRKRLFFLSPSLVPLDAVWSFSFSALRFLTTLTIRVFGSYPPTRKRGLVSNMGKENVSMPQKSYFVYELNHVEIIFWNECSSYSKIQYILQYIRNIYLQPVSFIITIKFLLDSYCKIHMQDFFWGTTICWN